jgi:hypothetical protein
MQRAISNLRWEKAQVYERDFWSKQVSPEAGEASRFRWYEDRAHRIEGQVKEFLGRHREISVLEIGPGPVGIINYIEADERHALDPLEDYYGSQAEFVHVRDRGVTRHNGTGEDILCLNIYTRFGAMVRNAMECLEIDKGHPFNFSQSRVLSLLQKSRFKVTWSQTEDYGVQKRKYRESRQLKKVFKSCLGVVDFRFTAFCRKV